LSLRASPAFQRQVIKNVDEADWLRMLLRKHGAWLLHNQLNGSTTKNEDPP
jgi:hypothetical protein